MDFQWTWFFQSESYGIIISKIRSTNPNQNISKCLKPPINPLSICLGSKSKSSQTIWIVWSPSLHRFTIDVQLLCANRLSEPLQIVDQELSADLHWFEAEFTGMVTAAVTTKHCDLTKQNMYIMWFYRMTYMLRTSKIGSRASHMRIESLGTGRWTLKNVDLWFDHDIWGLWTSKIGSKASHMRIESLGTGRDEWLAGQ